MKNPPFNHGAYEWRGAEGDYGYPMSLDGSIFRTKEILPKLTDLNYHNPNQLEGALAGTPIQLPKVLCFQHQVIVSVPLNRVQVENQNRCAGHEAKDFNDQWLSGKRLSLSKRDGRPFRSVHAEMRVSWSE